MLVVSGCLAFGVCYLLIVASRLCVCLNVMFGDCCSLFVCVVCCVLIVG